MMVAVQNAQRGVQVHTQAVRRVAELLLDLLPLEHAEVSIALVSDLRIQRLNKMYRERNRPTDVLSFDLADAPRKGSIEGEIVISLETVYRRSRGKPGAFQREMELLLAHGILHLMGHDHGTPRDKLTMQQAQRSLLARARRRLAAAPASILRQEGG